MARPHEEVVCAAALFDALREAAPGALTWKQLCARASGWRSYWVHRSLKQMVTDRIIQRVGPKYGALYRLPPIAYNPAP